jgi:hypothetical protein
MPSIPVPDLVAHLLPRADAHHWRGFERRALCTHSTVNIGEFIPLATNGVLTIIEFPSGRIDRLHLANIVWPERERKTSSRARAPLSRKEQATLKALFGLTMEDLARL